MKKISLVLVFVLILVLVVFTTFSLLNKDKEDNTEIAKELMSDFVKNSIDINSEYVGPLFIKKLNDGTVSISDMLLKVGMIKDFNSSEKTVEDEKITFSYDVYTDEAT